MSAPIVLRDYQRAAIDATYAYWKDGEGKHPLIVAPCGAGKSLMIGQFIKEAMQYPDTRVLMLCHKKELLEQDERAVRQVWKDAPTGFFSAGVGRRDWDAPILFAGIQTFVNHVHKFQPFDLVIIDEAHLIPRSAQTQYGRTIQTLLQMRPSTRFVGFTATPYRLDSGLLHEGDGALFDGIAYDIPLRKLIDDGYLVEVVARGSESSADMTGVKRRMGEFVLKDMAEAFADVLEPACAEIIERGQDRRAWIVFCASIAHAEWVTAYMRGHNISAAMITGSTPKRERARLLDDFRAGQIRCMVNVDVLTTGFDAPICDMAALLRATDSAALYVQIVGRIMRTHPGKHDALLLDYGGNVMRHGPIDRITPSRPTEGDGDAPAKECPDCMAIVHASLRECPDCGYEFPPPEPKVEPRAYQGAVMAHQVEPQWVDVASVGYSLHNKPGKPPSVRINYYTPGLISQCYSEWLLPEHGGYATQKTAVTVWGRYGFRCPATAAELIELLEDTQAPARIRIKQDGKYIRVLAVEFEEEKHEDQAVRA